ncbi:MAG: hypothetical protein IPJ88_15020 [Myxococcales bacterium]|nr:MAG: hypothetical protein IPJ88_15020 [Myxococcales bacterium]
MNDNWEKYPPMEAVDNDGRNMSLDDELDSLLTDLEEINDDHASVVVPLASILQQGMPSSRQRSERRTLDDDDDLGFSAEETQRRANPQKRPLALHTELPPLEGEASRQIEIQAAPEDFGAAAALQSFGIESTSERRPLSLPTQELTERVLLLSELAASKAGSTSARLYVAAAELCEQVGNADLARDLYRKALEASPLDLVALRALRRDAVTRRAWSEAARLLESEASLPLSPNERSLALSFLAEIQWQRLADPVSALNSAQQAAQLRPQSVMAGLALSNLYLVNGNMERAFLELERVSRYWGDREARSALSLKSAYYSEKQGDWKHARRQFEAALKDAPTSLCALLGIVRSSRATADLDRAVAALKTAENSAETGTKEYFAWLSSRFLQFYLNRHRDAARLLSEARGPLALRSRVDATLVREQEDSKAAALRDWVAIAGSSHRALGLIEMAILALRTNKIEIARKCLAEATLSDSEVKSIEALRELMARRFSDSESAMIKAAQDTNQKGSGNTAVARAARLVADPRKLTEEKQWLVHASEDEQHAICADVLLLDLAAIMNDTSGIIDGLKHHALRSPPSRRIGPLLALAEFAAREGDTENALKTLQQAHDLEPGNPVVLRPLGRLSQAISRERAAGLWLEEAHHSKGSQAAFAATNAARLLSASESQAVEALHVALKAYPLYGPARWSLEKILVKNGDRKSVAELHNSLQENSRTRPSGMSTN